MDSVSLSGAASAKSLMVFKRRSEAGDFGSCPPSTFVFRGRRRGTRAERRRLYE